jgi:hypothetical protein
LAARRAVAAARRAVAPAPAPVFGSSGSRVSRLALTAAKSALCAFQRLLERDAIIT